MIACGEGRLSSGEKLEACGGPQSFGSKIIQSENYKLEKGNHRIQKTIADQGLHLIELKIENKDGVKFLRKQILVVIK